MYASGGMYGAPEPAPMPPALKRERPSDDNVAPQQQQNQQNVTSGASQTSVFDIDSVDMAKEKLVPTWFQRCLEGEKQDVTLLQYQKKQLLRVLAESRVAEEQLRTEVERLRRESHQKDMVVKAAGIAWDNLDNVLRGVMPRLGEYQNETMLKTALEKYKSDYVEKLLGAPFSFSSRAADDAGDLDKVKQLVEQRCKNTQIVLASVLHILLTNRLAYLEAAEKIRSAAAAAGDGNTPEQMIVKDNEGLHCEVDRLQKLLDEMEVKMRGVMSQNAQLEDMLRTLHQEQEVLQKENEGLKEKTEKAVTQMCRKLSCDVLTPSLSTVSLSGSSSSLLPVSPTTSSLGSLGAKSPCGVSSSPAPAIAPKKMLLMQQQQQQQSQQQQQQQQHSYTIFGGVPAVLQSDALQPLIEEYEKLGQAQKQRIQELESQCQEEKARNARMETELIELGHRRDEDKRGIEEKYKERIQAEANRSALLGQYLQELTVKWGTMQNEVTQMQAAIQTLDQLMSSLKKDEAPQQSPSESEGAAAATQEDELKRLRAEVASLQTNNEFLLKKASLYCPVTVAVNEAASSSSPSTDAASGESGQSPVPTTVTKELRDVIGEEIEKLKTSSEQIVASLKNQIAHLTAESPSSDEGMIEELGSIGTVCEQLQQQNTTLTQQLTTQYDQFSKLSRDKIAMELRLNELTRDLEKLREEHETQLRSLRGALEQSQQQVRANAQLVEQASSLSKQLQDEKMNALTVVGRLEQMGVARQSAEKEAEALKQTVSQLQGKLQDDAAELARVRKENDVLDHEIRRDVLGLVWVYRHKLKYALSLLAGSGASPAPAVSPSKGWRKKPGAAAGGPSSLNLPPALQCLLPPEDEEIDSFECAGKALLGSGSADTDGTMVDEDLGSLYRARVKCSVCGERDRSCVLKRCGHTFCEQCITKCLQNRNRKCPTCHTAFGDTDVVKLVL